LKHLPIDQLKIDKVCIEYITNSQSDAFLMDTIIAMAKHIKLTLVAERV
jgi:sensor c-di-GMP phosphodiesterase-like protein